MILITNEENTRLGKYDGFSTNLLIGNLNTSSDEISIQITNIMPNKMQFVHCHPEAQCYYIISGEGNIIIADEEADVSKGDAIFIPGNSPHGIKNTGNDILKYLTANKPFGKDREMKIWFQETKPKNQFQTIRLQ